MLCRTWKAMPFQGLHRVNPGMPMQTEKAWTLIGPDGQPYKSNVPGTLGGHRRTKIFGYFHCPSALRAIARGGYVKHRVFFLDESVARAAGYRPCAVCLPDKYATWKASRARTGPDS